MYLHKNFTLIPSLIADFYHVECIEIIIYLFMQDVIMLSEHDL